MYTGPDVSSDHREEAPGSNEQLSGRSVTAHTGGIYEKRPGPCRKNRDNRNGHQTHEVPSIERLLNG